MAKRLRQSNLYDTFSKKHKESDSEEMSQQEESDTQTVTTTSDIEAESAQNTGYRYDIESQSYDDLQTDDWYKKYPWLTICTTRKKVFCFYCRVEGQGMMTFSSKAESTFTKIGYNNWKKALEKFENHNHCNAHGEVVLKWQMLQTTPISNHLNSQIKKQSRRKETGIAKTATFFAFSSSTGFGNSWP